MKVNKVLVYVLHVLELQKLNKQGHYKSNKSTCNGVCCFMYTCSVLCRLEYVRVGIDDVGSRGSATLSD